MVRRIFKYIASLTIFLILVFGIFVLSVYFGFFGKLHSTTELQAFKNQTASLVLSEHGELIGKYFSENRTNIKFEYLPKHLVDALIATEDARYFEHDGVDTKSLLRVIFKTILTNNKSSGGGSTINQQLVKNMYGRENHGFLTMPINKIKEAFLAYRLSKVYSKSEILTLYFNTVPFGENTLGIEAASRRFFNKSINNIKIDEAAILIGLLKANTYYNPRLYPKRALKRRNIVLSQMNKYSFISTKEKNRISKLPIKLNYENLELNGPANYFLAQIKKEVSKILDIVNKEKGTNYDINRDGLIIITTLNKTLQKNALHSFENHLSMMQEKMFKQYSKGYYKRVLDKLVNNKINKLNLIQVDIKKKRELFSWKGYKSDSISIRDSLRYSMSLLHAGLIAVNPQNGAIKAWVGGIDYNSQKYDQIYAQRQLASTFKPILYASALEQGMMPCSYLKNDSIVLDNYKNWHPQNYDHSVGGEYSMAAALAKSKNLPTVNLFLQTDFSKLENLWSNLGFSNKLLNEPSISLGAANASIYELAIAYSAFANGGYHIKPQFIKNIKTADGKIIYNNELVTQQDNRIIKSSSSQLLSAILQKAINEGTGVAMRSNYDIKIPIAGKTGTSQNYADAWFAAYTPKLVLITRVGASSPNIHFSTGANGSGSRLALPIVAKTLFSVQNEYKKDFILDDEYKAALECDDYREVSIIESVFKSIFDFSNLESKFDTIKYLRKKKRMITKTSKRSKRDSLRKIRKEKRRLRREKRSK